jgi:hypothetical protein
MVAPLRIRPQISTVSTYQRVPHGHEGSGLVNEVFDRYAPLQLGNILFEFFRFAQFGCRRDVFIRDQRRCLTIRLVYFIVFTEKGAVLFRTHLAKISRGVEVSLGRESAVVVRKREASRVRGHPHLAGPVKGTERIGGSWSNLARRAHFRVGDVKGDRCWEPGSAEIISCATWELKLVNNRYVFQRNCQSVFRYFYGVIRHLHDPEKTI